jgi:probable rRNA maturation factor
MTAASARTTTPNLTAPSLTVDILTESPQWDAQPGAEATVRGAIAQAAAVEGTADPGAEVAVLLCDDAVIAALNARWRGRDEPTNVLSFPAPPPAILNPPADPAAPAHLGDIAIACETVIREAQEQGKPVSQHLAHLAVHGFLHLLGYDHGTDGEAERMERLEREILASLGIPDPYAVRDA